MKQRMVAFIACLVAAACGISPADDSGEMPAREESAGLRIALAPIADEQSIVFRVALENTGDKDLMVNLGMMLANGKAMFPLAIRFILVDPKGESKEIFLDGPRIIGRVDDFAVPLRAGSTYSLRLSLDDYWCPGTREYRLALKPGTYRIQAVLHASGVQSPNGDMQGMKLMNFWIGTLTSSPVEFAVPE